MKLTLFTCKSGFNLQHMGSQFGAWSEFEGMEPGDDNKFIIDSDYVRIDSEDEDGVKTYTVLTPQRVHWVPVIETEGSGE